MPQILCYKGLSHLQSAVGMKDPPGVECILMYCCPFPFAIYLYLHRLQLIVVQPSPSSPSSFVETDIQFLSPEQWVSLQEIPILPTENCSSLSCSPLQPFSRLPSKLTSIFFYFTCPSSTRSLFPLPCACWGIIVSRQHSNLSLSHPPPLHLQLEELWV